MPTKISALPAAGSLTGAEIVPAVQSSSTIRTTLTAIYNYIITFPSSQQAARAAISADLTPTADKLQYWTGASTDALTAFTAFARTLVGSANAAAALSNLGIGSQITNALGSDVLLNNTGTFFDGPSIAQGTTGVWWVTGQVTCIDTAGAAVFNAKLWDGTTVIASGVQEQDAANSGGQIALSGFISSPAGNIRISVKDSSTTSGKILFNLSGASKDSAISAFRIA